MIAVIGFFLAATGATLGMVGAFMMARSYHPFSLVDFARQANRILWKLILWNRSEAIRTITLASKLGKLNREDRTYSLLGLYLVFLGFCMQLLGLALSFIANYSQPSFGDALLPNFSFILHHLR